MTDSIKAKIYWVSADAGGRKLPPSGPRYSTVARFEEEAPHGESVAWGIIAEFDEPPNASLETMANIRFFVPPGPIHLLHAGSRFELYEGHRVVARGEVLSEHVTGETPASDERRPSLITTKDRKATS